jgi:hypothetical protein
LSESKSIRWSYLLSLLLTVAAASAAFLLLASVERGQIEMQLADCAAHGSVDEAVVAVRRLGELPRPPIEPLVTAAATPSREVAREAQLAINELLRHWQRQLAAGKSSRRILGQLELLAASLERHLDRFSPRDHGWLEKTAERIVHLANVAPLDTDGRLAIRCDSLLTKLSQQPEADVRVSAKQPPISPPTPPKITPISQPAPATGAASPSTTDSVFSPPSEAAIDSLLPTDAAKRRLPESSDVAWTPKWMSPTRLTAPAPLRAEPIVAVPIRRQLPPPTAFAPAESNPRSRYSSTSSRELLIRWLTADDFTARDLEHELRSRGFRLGSKDIISTLVHADAPTRTRLVYELIGLPGGEAKAWLALMAEDESADVRVAALTVMATSSDGELLDKAWDIAVHDRDPRVASLAERLRERRSAITRR